MLMAKELQKIFPRLFQDEKAQATFDLADISIRIFEKGTRLALSTPVYFGGNYIPQGVRKSLERTQKFPSSHLNTFVTIDEENFRIYLHHNAFFSSFSEEGFASLLDEFNFVADEWRHYLDDHDKNDLIYISSKK